jgi:uncharacterized membrane protein
VLHAPGSIRLAPGIELYVLYPLLPWIGVMAVGYALGALLAAPPNARQRRLTVIGALLCLGFLALRAVNVYGDPRPWAPLSSSLWTVFSFINTEKYPPSLLYLLMTLGPALLALAALDRAATGAPQSSGVVGGVLAVYGRAPLFFYIVHLPLLHALADFAARGQRSGLPGVYVIWLAVAAALYLPSRWFGAVKQYRKEWFWRYL